MIVKYDLGGSIKSRYFAVIDAVCGQMRSVSCAVPTRPPNGELFACYMSVVNRLPTGARSASTDKHNPVAFFLTTTVH